MPDYAGPPGHWRGHALYARCSSCNTRRMAETAGHLVDHVFPQTGGALGFVPALTARIKIAILYPSWCGACVGFGSRQQLDLCRRNII